MTFDEQIKLLTVAYVNNPLAKWDKHTSIGAEYGFRAGANAAREILQWENDRLLKKIEGVHCYDFGEHGVRCESFDSQIKHLKKAVDVMRDALNEIRDKGNKLRIEEIEQEAYVLLVQRYKDLELIADQSLSEAEKTLVRND